MSASDQKGESRAVCEPSGLDRCRPSSAGPADGFPLRQHAGLRAEALDDAAHERPDRRRGDQHRRLALRAASSKRSRTSVMNSDSRDGCIARLRSSPCRRSIRRRSAPTWRTARSAAGSRRGVVCCAQIWRARRARTCSAIVTGLRVKAIASAMPSRMVERSRIEMRSVSRICSTRWMPDTVIWRRHDVLDQLALLLRQFLEELLHLGVGQQVGHVGLEQLGQMGRHHGRGIDDRVALERRLFLQGGIDPGRGQAEGRLGGVEAGQVHLRRRPGP